MTKRFTIPNENINLTKTFVYELVKQIRDESLLETEGVVLVCGDIEIVIGDYGANIFNDKSVVDDLCLNMSPIIYELIGYLAPDLSYGVVSDIPFGTGLCRVLHVQDGQRYPLFASNLSHIKFDGCWLDVDMTRPSSVCATFELMGTKPNQSLTFRGNKTDLDVLDFSAVNLYECSRLSSLVEVVMRKRPLNTRLADPTVDRFLSVISHYQKDQNNFMGAMMMGRSAFALAFWIFTVVKNVDLIFGNLSPGIADRFIESLWDAPDQQVVQLLEVSRYHSETAYSKILEPYFARHQVVPFFVEIERNLLDGSLQKACESLASFVLALQ